MGINFARARAVSCVFSRLFFVSFLLLFPVLGFAAKDKKQEPVKPAPGCGGALDEDDDFGYVANTLDELMSKREAHPLSSVLEFDNPSQNLGVKHPSLLLDALKKNYGYAISQGVETIANPNSVTGTVRRYNAISKPKERGARRMYGNYREIDRVIDGLSRKADGDGSASKMQMLIGPAGAAKTEFLMIFLGLAHRLTLKDPNYFEYTYEFKGLANDFPELVPFLQLHPNSDETGIHEHPFRCPIGDSPMVLLPDVVQAKIARLGAKRAKEIFGKSSLPFKAQHACSQCAFIRDTVLTKYMEKNNLTVDQISGKNEANATARIKVMAEHWNKALGPYVTLRRSVLGADGNVPKINSEGADPDYSAIFIAQRPSVFNDFGPNHPFAHWWNTATTRGHRGMLFWDEFYRNNEKFRDMTLELQENGIISRSGVTARINAWHLGAANNESLEKARADGTVKAQIDRQTIIPMFYERNPLMVAKTWLGMKNESRLEMQKLQPLTKASDAEGPSGADGEEDDGDENDDEAKLAENASGPVPADLDMLFVEPTDGSPMIGLDRRYKLFVKAGDSRVHISPRTLLYMAKIAAATRMATDSKAALKHGPRKVAASMLFTDVATRLRAIMREGVEITDGEAKELEELADLLQEGNFGISNRDGANNWLSEAVAEAQKPENGNCVTPQVARDVFFRLLRQGGIAVPNMKVREEWGLIADYLSKEFLVPGIEDDVQTAMGSGTGIVDNAYDEIFHELLAISRDENATHYKIGHERRGIDHARLTEVGSIYRKKIKKSLVPEQLFAFHAPDSSANRDPSRPPRRHGGLLSAITSYYTKRAKDLISLTDISDYFAGKDVDKAVESKGYQVGKILDHELGYCKHCMKASVEYVKQAASGTAQARHQH